jgi:hypothetical protein
MEVQNTMNRINYNEETYKTQIALLTAQNLRLKEDNQRLRETNKSIFSLSKLQTINLEEYTKTVQTLKIELDREKEQSNCTICNKRHPTVFLSKYGVCPDCEREEHNRILREQGYKECNCCLCLVPPNDLEKIESDSNIWDICLSCREYKANYFFKDKWTIELIEDIRLDYIDMEDELR